MEYNLSALLTKVKLATKQAANVTVKQTKLARLRFDLMTVHSQRAKHLQNIGQHLISLHKQEATFDQTSIFSDLKSEIDAIELLDRRIAAIEAQLETEHLDNIEVKDVTP